MNKRKTLETLIKNSIDIKFFQSLYFYLKDDRKSVDILKKGSLSCAFYVSVLLKICDLIKDIHTTVDGVIRDLETSGWYKIKKPKKLAVLVWEKSLKHGHKHIGFYLGKNLAVSNSAFKRVPSLHSLNYDNRNIEFIYFHNDLDNKNEIF